MTGWNVPYISFGSEDPPPWLLQFWGHAFLVNWTMSISGYKGCWPGNRDLSPWGLRLGYHRHSGELFLWGLTQCQTIKWIQCHLLRPWAQFIIGRVRQPAPWTLQLNSRKWPIKKLEWQAVWSEWPGSGSDEPAKAGMDAVSLEPMMPMNWGGRGKGSIKMTLGIWHSICECQINQNEQVLISI